MKIFYKNFPQQPSNPDNALFTTSHSLSESTGIHGNNTRGTMALSRKLGKVETITTPTNVTMKPPSCVFPLSICLWLMMSAGSEGSGMASPRYMISLTISVSFSLAAANASSIVPPAPIEQATSGTYTSWHEYPSSGR